MRKWSIHKSLFPIFLLSTFIYIQTGCKCKKEEKKEGKVYSQTEKSDSSPFSNMVFLLPAPSEVMFIINNYNIRYNANLMAPLGLEKNLVVSNHQALIMGVYLTDFSYNLLFKNYNSGFNCLNSIKTISKDMGLNVILDEPILKRVEDNIHNIDSIDAIFNEFLLNSFNSIESSGNYEILSLIAMGSGIESIYIGYNSLNFNHSDSLLVNNMLDQKIIFENYYKNFINYNYNKPEMDLLITDLNKIYRLYEQSVTLIPNNKHGSTSNYTTKVKDIPMLNKKNLKQLGDSIEIVRNKIIDLNY